MFDRFTDRSRRVLILAQDEARELAHDYIGTEHLLLGMIREADGVAAKVLGQMGASYDKVRERATTSVDSTIEPSRGSPPFTLRAKKVLELSLREASRLNHSYIGTEHLLLALVREGGGVGIQILNDLGIEGSFVRSQVLQLIPTPLDVAEQSRDAASVDDGALRSYVRALGRELRPDLDGATLDTWANSIVDELSRQIRQRWSEPHSTT